MITSAPIAYRPTPGTDTTPPPAGGATHMPYGTSGRISDYVTPAGSGRYETAPGWTPASSGLPDWLQNQFSWIPTDTNVSENGAATPGHWQLNSMLNNPFGALTDATGNQVVQIGDPEGWNTGSGDWSIIDPNQIHYDENLGWVTSPSNMRDVPENNWQTFLPAFLAAVGGGYALEALGGTAAAGAGGAGVDTTLLPGFVPPEVGSLGATPEILGGAATPSAAVVADGLTPQIESLLPGFTPPGIGTLPELPDITFPGGPLEEFGPTPGMREPVMQPPPGVDVAPPNVGQPGTFDRLLNRVTDDPLRAAGTAATVGSLVRGGHSGATASPRGTVAANGPLGTDARNVLTNHGAPTPDQRSAIDMGIEEQRRHGTEAIIQASVNAGQGGKESMVVQDKLRSFNQSLETMRQELYMKQAEQNTALALRELGLIDEETFLLARLELQQDTNAQNRAMSIMRSLGWLWAQNGSGGGGGGG